MEQNLKILEYNITMGNFRGRQIFQKLLFGDEKERRIEIG